MSLIYLNGEYLAKDQAKISIFDRGFLFGDSVYEVIPIYAGKPFQLKPHLDRLEKSLQAIDITLNYSQQQWSQICDQLIKKADNEIQGIYLQVSRGADECRRHNYPETLQPTVVAFCLGKILPSQDKMEQGVNAITLSDPRWQHCHIKTTNLLGNILALNQAKIVGAQDAILLREDSVIEATSSNVFVIKNGELRTPALQKAMLSGVTRAVIIELAKELNIPFKECDIIKSELNNADEIWISGSGKEIMPVTKLDGRPVNDGKPGPLWTLMLQHYRHYITRQVEHAS